jgi:integrase
MRKKEAVMTSVRLSLKLTLILSIRKYIKSESSLSLNACSLPRENEWAGSSVWTTINTPQLPAISDDTKKIPQITQPARRETEIRKAVEEAKLKGKTPNTQLNYYYRLKQLDKVADLMNPTEVKTAIAYSQLSCGSKRNYATAYDFFTKVHGLAWEKPKFKFTPSIPIIPTTKQVEAIINSATPRYAVVFMILKETGAEPEELHNTHRKQIDTQQGIISITGTKGHGSGNYRLQPQTVEMLREYLTKNPQECPFAQAKYIGEMWRYTRDKLANIMKQPELKKIPLKSLRNYSGAQFYLNNERDAIGTMRHLRHKKLETTMHYLRAIVLDYDPEYISRISTTIEEDTKLIEAGFQYITERDGIKLYRKRK